MKIVLIGFRATGKTSVGKILAQKLGLPFLDLDEYLAQKEGQSIAEMVSQKGWPYFRTQEKKALLELARLKEGVFALGGGAVMHEDEMELLKETACVVWLKAPPQLIAKRLAGDDKTAFQRPSLTGRDVLDEIETVLSKREPLYHRFADLELETAQRGPEEIAEKIISLLNRCLCSGVPQGR